MSKNLLDNGLSSYEDIQILYKNCAFYEPGTKLEITGNLYTKFKNNLVDISKILPGEILKSNDEWDPMDSNVLNMLDLKCFLVSTSEPFSYPINELGILRSLLEFVLTFDLKDSSNSTLCLNQEFSKNFSNYESLLNYLYISFIVNQESVTDEGTYSILETKTCLYADDFLIFIFILLNNLNSIDTLKIITKWLNYNFKYLNKPKSDCAIYDYKKGAFDEDVAKDLVNYIYNWTSDLNKNIDFINGIKSDNVFLILCIASGFINVNSTKFSIKLIKLNKIPIDADRLESTLSKFKTLNELLLYSN